MSTKQQLAEAIDALPDSISMEEAVERIYRAFKLKQARSAASPGSRSIEDSFGLLHRTGQKAMSTAEMDEALARAVEDENRDDRR